MNPDGLARLKGMPILIEREVRRALSLEAALETANNLVHAAGDDTKYNGAGCYNAITDGLTLSLAFTTAKLFEMPRARKNETELERAIRSDVASIRLLLLFLREPDYRKALIDDARTWTPMAMEMEATHVNGCEAAIDDAISSFDQFFQTANGSAAIVKLEDFRNKFLAHNLTVAMNARPTYDDLFALVDLARDICERSSLAVLGKHIDLRKFEQGMVKESEDFWVPALRAATIA